jgi:hypothetical protein
VTPNLYFALRRIRQSLPSWGCYPYLWIDAICINQEDLQERTNQVKMMGDIFENAFQVLVWLGEEEVDTDGEIAVDLLKALFESFNDFVQADDGGKNGAQ